ncbi:MAG: hypothetical protein ABIJ52_06945, partial [Pseudomonadota bacterium]
SIAKKSAFFAFGGSPMKFGALTAALLPEFQLLPFSNKLPVIVLKLAHKLINCKNFIITQIKKDRHCLLMPICHYYI